LSDKKKLKTIRYLQRFCEELMMNLGLIIIIGDESWCFQYDTETKKPKCRIIVLQLNKAKKALLQKSCAKVMLTTFLDSKWVNS
jgi:hypothetical protein